MVVLTASAAPAPGKVRRARAAGDDHGHAGRERAAQAAGGAGFVMGLFLGPVIAAIRR